MKLRRPALIVFACLLGVAGAGAGYAQSPTQAARDDAKTFGRTRIPDAQTAARTTPTVDTMPNFSATPPQQVYLDDPDGLAAAATAQAPAHSGYSAVRESITTRAAMDPVDIAATIARSNEIQADPDSYVSGMSITGSTGSCVALPPAVASPGTYEQACNRGFTRSASTSTCPVTLRHSIAIRVEYRYECTPEPLHEFNRTDGCGLFSAAGCATTGRRPGRCLQQRCDPDGRNCFCAEPGEPIEQLLCPAAVTGGTLLGTVDTPTVTRSVDDSACAALAATSGCARSAEVCIDAAPATRTVAGVPITEACWGWERSYRCTGLRPRQDCAALEGMGCSFLREECITGLDPCLTFDRVYACPIPPVEVGGPQFICDGDIYCINGECEEIVREPNTEFGQAAVALNAVAEAGKQLDPATLTLFRGTRHTCSRRVFGITDCCVPRGFPLVGSCNGGDRLLKTKRDNGLCARVGSYCSSRVLGVCLTRREAHCCFESKLSRILQEQGRPQIGWAWAPARDETCGGFTLDQFARLDLSRMNFDEVIAEFVDAARLPTDLEIASDLQAKIEAYYASRGL